MLEVSYECTREAWDAFLIARQGHLFQSWAWGTLMEREGKSIIRLGVLEDGKLVAAALAVVFTLPYVKAPWLYVLRGPVVDDPSSPALPAIINELHRIARKKRAVVLKIEPNIEEGTPGWREALKGLGFHPNPIPTHVRRSWLLDIRPMEQKLLAGMKRSWRYNIKVAERGGIQVHVSTTPQDMEAFYRIYQQTSQRDDFTILPLKHYTNILDLFGEDARLFRAEHKSETLVGHLLIRYGTWCWDMFGATAEAYSNLKPGYLLHWKTFLWAKEKGCEIYDFRGIPEILEPGEEMWNVYEYKRGFGGFSQLSLETHDYIYRPLLYWPLTLVSRARVAQRRRQRRRWELERKQRGESSKSAEEKGEEQEALSKQGEAAQKE